MNRQEPIKKMTLREKVDFLTGGAFFKTRAYPQYGIRDMYLSDGPHGLRKQADAADHLGLHKSLPATCFPTASIMACSWDESLGEEVGSALGREAASMDVDMILGPGLNIKRNPLCGRNFEYFSEDPYLTGKMAAAYVRGIQSEHVNACVKHFAVNNREFRRMTSNSIVDERTLREIYLTGFEIAIKEGHTNTVMSSYNRLNGIYTNENAHILKEILRTEWGFGGVVVTDWAGSNSRVEGLKCGNELEMPPCKYGADDLYAAVERGEIEESLLDESIEHILELIAFSDSKKREPFDIEVHHELARKCARKSLVLLENDGTLPLKKTAKIALIGDFAFRPRYQGAGSSVVNPTKLTTAKEALLAAGITPAFEEVGFHRFGKEKKKLHMRAIKAALQAEVVLFFAGLDEFSEAEGLDRTHIGIPENQKDLCRALIATGKKVVVVLSCGSVVETGWTQGAAAVLYAGLSGQAGALAVVDVLFGDANPSGKLAESWPVRYEDVSTSEKSYFPGGRDNVEYREGLFVGYRYFATAGVKPRYPFGYGLSYTTFEYSNVRADKDGVTFTVKNTGKVAGDEIAQVYISKKDSRIIRPEIELKGFARVHLEAGEEKEITVAFNERTFAYYDVAAKAWQIEAGAYEIKVGASSEDVRLTARIELEGVIPQDERTSFPDYAAGNIKNVPDEEFYSLLGYAPEREEAWNKKKRLLVHENSTVQDLQRAPGWMGRTFSWAIRTAIWFLHITHNRAKENELIMGMLHQPVRGMAKFQRMSRKGMERLIRMFNGRAGKKIAKEKEA